MPLLASASAHMQGKALVEICTVYGVSLVPLGGERGEPTPDHGLAHGFDHCALTALTALATPESTTLDMAAAPRHEVAALAAYAGSRAPDACAAWVARLKHGPPSLA